MINTLLVLLRKSLLLLPFVLGSFSTYAQLDEIGNSNSRFYYSGNLGMKASIELNMQVSGYTVSGSYMFVSNGDIFVFKGRLSADKTGMGVLVYDSDNSYVASIEAKVISEDVDFAREIKGRWKPVDGGISKNLILSKVAEFAHVPSESKSSVAD